MEALGTFFLVLAIGLTTNPFAIGITLAVLIYVGRYVSGAHYNPAVAFAFFLKKRLTASEFLAYVLSQLSGAFIAAYVIYLFSSLVFYIVPPAETNLYQQAGAEILFSFLFILVMLNFSLTPVLRKNHLFGFAVGLSFAGAIFLGSQISGGMLNPVVSISTALFDLLHGGNSYEDIILYTLSPLTGGAAAAFVYTYFELK